VLRIGAFSFALAFLAFGCGGGSHLHGRMYRDDEAHYRIGELGSGWSSVSVPDNDVAFHNGSLGAIVQVNASCDPAADIPLTVLTNHLLAGFTARETISEDRVPMDGREALRTHVMASLDGVPRELLIYVLKKNDCVYDLTLITPPGSNFTASLTTFEGFVGGFSTESSASGSGAP
jgi:hypothetical protein